MKVYIVNVNNCEAYSDYYEGNRGVYLTYQDAVDAMTELGFDPSTKTKVIPWYDFENEKDWFESGWYDREAYRIEEWELPERTCKSVENVNPEFWFKCSECGHVMAKECSRYFSRGQWIRWYAPPNYCPNCGAKVAE